jgi:hypothetical protein
MSEDFGMFGDEQLLDPHNFALELNELAAMDYEEQQAVLRELAQESEDEDAESWDKAQDDCEDNLSDVEADSMTLASAGWGTDEDYGDYGGGYDG